MNKIVQPVEVTAKWREFTKSQEDQRLAVLDERIARRQWSLDYDVKERQRIMHRAIRRMRRAEGKE